MCGRFVFAVDPADLQEAFPWLILPDQLTPRYNIAPTQPVPVVVNDGQHRLAFFRWGLIPSWASDPGIGNRMINARAETVAEKPSFRAAFRRRRCLVLASGFYEWRKQPGARAKTPMYVRLTSGAPFAFAGLWELWRPAGAEPISSCTIITTTPNALLAPIHNRMPVILEPGATAQWLNPEEQDPAALSKLLRPYPASEMAAHPVSRLINNPRNDSPECIRPAA